MPGSIAAEGVLQGTISHVCTHTRTHEHTCIHTQGRGSVPGAIAAQEVLQGATYNRPIPEGWSDLRRPHIHKVPPPVSDTVHQVIKGTASEFLQPFLCAVCVIM